MSQNADELPSSDINPGNALARVQECQKYLTLQMWTQYSFLYKHLAQFQDIRVRGAGKMLRDDDEFTKAWNALRTSSVDMMLKCLESAQSFEEFKLWINHLAPIINDPRTLWNIIHTEVQCSLKVTLEQSREIQDAFFTHEMLFEYSLESFLQSSLCDFKEANSEEALVDIFYAAAGFIRACQLPDEYRITQKPFIDHVENLLVHFTEIPDFDANRFVWLVEAIHDHLHLMENNFIQICKSVLEKMISHKDTGGGSISKLYKMCVISTSPFLQSLQVIRDSIDKAFEAVLIEQHSFARKYIFGGYVNCLWTGLEQKRISDPLRTWVLYIHNLEKKIKAHSELPVLLLADFIDDSLQYFFGYYGEVQATKERAVNLRMDLFTIVQTVKEVYPIKFTESALKKLWFLMTIAAVCGATDEQLQNIKQETAKSDDPFLGLKHDGRDFENYSKALGCLQAKFKDEVDAFPIMIEFIRKRMSGVIEEE